MKTIYGLLIIAILGLMAGCITQKKCNERYPPRVIDSVAYVERWHDTTVYITDSAGITAVLECDTAGIVRIKAIKDHYTGQFVKPTIIIRDNVLETKCIIDSGAVASRWLERNFTSFRVIVQKENYLTSFQHFLIWLGPILLGLIVIYVAIRLFLK